MDGVGTAAQLDQPKALVMDVAGAYLYWTDRGNLAVRKLALADNTVTTVKKLEDTPAGLAFDGDSLIVSTEEHHLFRLDPVSGALTLLAGGEVGFTDATGAAARFSSPAGLINDGQGNLYIADTDNFAVRKMSLSTGAVTTVAGANSTGSADGALRQARFNVPQGLAAAGGGVLYVADTNNHVLRKLSLQTGEVTTFAGSVGQPGTEDGTGTQARFNHPSALALDTDGSLYVADTDNGLLRKVDPASGAVVTLTLTAEDGFAGFGAPAGFAQVGRMLYVTDNRYHVVVGVDLDRRTMSVLAGKAGLTGANDRTGADARFSYPQGIASDGKGSLFVADSVTNLIRKINLSSAAVTTLVGAPSRTGSDDGVGSAARLYYPTQLTVDAYGNIFVIDSLNTTVREIESATGKVTTLVGNPHRSGVQVGPLPGQLGTPTAIALTPEGELVLASENCVLVTR
jgi:sugar lactone lactonase YvrE